MQLGLIRISCVYHNTNLAPAYSQPHHSITAVRVVSYFSLPKLKRVPRDLGVRY